MTLDELYKEIGRIGCMPLVSNGKSVGKVVTVKDNGSYKGIAVRYPLMGYDLWYHAEHGQDKRSKYMSELKIVDHGS